MKYVILVKLKKLKEIAEFSFQKKNNSADLFWRG